MPPTFSTIRSSIEATVETEIALKWGSEKKNIKSAKTFFRQKLGFNYGKSLSPFLKLIFKIAGFKLFITTIIWWWHNSWKCLQFKTLFFYLFYINNGFPFSYLNFKMRSIGPEKRTPKPFFSNGWWEKNLKFVEKFCIIDKWKLSIFRETHWKIAEYNPYMEKGKF